MIFLVVICRYSGAISIGVDMANHFCEWMTDYNLPDSHILRRNWGPSEEQREFFVRTYLRERFEKEPTDEEVKALCLTVEKHEMLSDMHWFLWGLIQYPISDIDWDYWMYADCRWTMYKDTKKMFYGVDALPVMS